MCMRFSDLSSIHLIPSEFQLILLITYKLETICLKISLFLSFKSYVPRKIAQSLVAQILSDLYISLTKKSI